MCCVLLSHLSYTADPHYFICESFQSYSVAIGLIMHWRDVNYFILDISAKHTFKKPVNWFDTFGVQDKQQRDTRITLMKIIK